MVNLNASHSQMRRGLRAFRPLGDRSDEMSRIGAARQC
jgi:hypothetical protein